MGGTDVRLADEVAVRRIRANVGFPKVLDEKTSEIALLWTKRREQWV